MTTLPRFSLTAKVAIVTGAKRGIGRTIAQLFAHAGANVVVADVVVDDGQLEAVAKEIQNLGRHSLAVQVDVTRKADVNNMVLKTLNEFGGVDILANVAGITTRVTPMDITEEEWDRVMDIDLKGCLFCAQAVGKRMIEQGKGGNIINISSTAGVKTDPNRGGYGSAKVGLIMLTKQLAIGLGQCNIRVNAIAPGPTKTELSRDMWSNPEAYKRLAAQIPLNRWAEPIEIANAALFLASDMSSFVTGITLCVDGGLTAG
jgi:NAD(P)-dependent dehydrogenase (short-subunit alcohol dehydrogenase family)